MEVNNKTICLNGKVDGKQPSLTNRVYDSNGCSTAITTSPFFMGSILETPIKIMEEPKIIQRPHGYNQGAELEDCPSITVSSWQENNLLKEPNYRIRKLTPKECWRLMDFGDEDFEKAKAVGISDSQAYKQAGNSIVVAVLKAIFGEML